MKRESELREITETLTKRPEIKALFDLILSFPEEEQDQAVQIALNSLKGGRVS